MEAFLFSLVINFCSPVVCEEYIVDHSLTERDCTQAAKLAEGLYMNINNRVLYSHYANSYGAEYIDGYPEIVDREIKCTVEV